MQTRNRKECPKGTKHYTICSGIQAKLIQFQNRNISFKRVFAKNERGYKLISN